MFDDKVARLQELCGAMDPARATLGSEGVTQLLTREERQDIRSALQHLLYLETDTMAMLREAFEKGACMSEALQAHHEAHELSAEDEALLAKARETVHRDGEIELDDYSVPSGNDDPAGDYVLAWVWVWR